MSISFGRMAGKAFLVASLLACLPGKTLLAQQKADSKISSIEKNKRDNTPKSVVFSASASYHPDDAPMLFSKYLGIKGSENKMVLASTTKTKTKLAHYKYDQWFKGLKVSFASYTLTSKDNIVHFMTGNVYKTNSAASTTPCLSERDAFNKALDYVGAKKYMWQDAAAEQQIKAKYHNPDTSYMPKGQLTWIENFNDNTDDRTLHLAYSFDIYARAPLSRQVVYIDAATGAVLLSNSLIKHTAAHGNSMYSGDVAFGTSHIGANYILFDSSRGDGVHTLNMHNGTDYGAATEFSSATNTWPTSAADSQSIDAQWAGTKVYDYWDSVQGRLSWDNLNGILVQYVHYNTAYDNAFWDGSEMTYGDGSGCGAGGFTALVSLDVTAHEIGHGVCQATANLISGGEPGALNEGLSDCWGASVENFANPHETDAVPKQIWKMGEELGCGTPLRSLDFPKLQGLPDTYHGTNWVNTTGCTPSPFNDECGVHTNLGIITKWYYLLTVGGSGTNDLGNAYSVTGIGFAEAENILYQTELVMPSNADYPATRAASINVVNTLYGPCSPEAEAVASAWYAVGVGTVFDPCVPKIAFVNTASMVTENANANSCTGSHIVMIPIKETGTPVIGGVPTVTIVATNGTAISGVNYMVPATTFSFAPGDTSTKFIPVTIYDNGALGANKTFTLSFILDSAGTSTITSPVAGTDLVTIVNDDFAPVAGGAAYHTVGDSSALSNNTSPFYSNGRMAHSQFLIYASELTAAGVVPNIPITQVAFKVATKNSTVPFSNYNMSLAHTTIADMDGGFVTTGFTTVFTGEYTTHLGMDTIPFSTSFTWDGASNVVMDVCYTNTALGTSNDRVVGHFDGGGNDVCAYTKSSASSGTGCALPYSPTQVSAAKPVMRFQQSVQPTNVETTATVNRSWDVKAGQEVYFYGLADTGVIMGLKNPSADLGCVNTTLRSEGNGFGPFSYSPGVNRSIKEFAMTPTINGSTTNYKATLYFTNTELAGVDPATLYIFKTDAATDADITPSNSMYITPTLVVGENYTGFAANFTGFSRFFLTDAPLTAVANVANEENTIRIENNPFHDNIYVSYSVPANMTATIRLYDVTGRAVYTVVNDLTRGNHKFTVDCSGLDLPTGTYIMQVVTPTGVYTRKLLKA